MFATTRTPGSCGDLLLLKGGWRLGTSRPTGGLQSINIAETAMVIYNDIVIVHSLCAARGEKGMVLRCYECIVTL